MNQYLDRTRAWESPADGELTIRGRRVDGNGPTLHFLSGNGFCGGVYWRFLQHFLPDFGLFLHDIEGHGESDVPPKFSGTGALARRTLQVIEQQGLRDGRSLIGIGHSRGAAMTLKLAADNPGLFKAVVLLDPIILPAPVWYSWRMASVLGLNSMANSTRKRRFAWASRDAAYSHLKGRGIFRGWDDEAVADFVDHAMKPAPAHGATQEPQWVLRCPLELEAQIYEHPVYPWHAIRKVNVPVLFLYGDRSYGFFPWTVRATRRVNPRIELAPAPGQHCFMLEHPQETATTVRDWLGHQPA